jgi:hypothetical protein
MAPLSARVTVAFPLRSDTWIGNPTSGSPAAIRWQNQDGMRGADPDRMVAEAALECRTRELLLAVRGHQRRVDVQHDDSAQVGPGDLRCGKGRQLGNHVPVGRGPGLLHPTQRGRGELVQCPPHRRGRSDRPQHPALMTQHVDAGPRCWRSPHHRRRALLRHRSGPGPVRGPGRTMPWSALSTSSAVSPVRSASSRTATDPACATTPVSSAAADNPEDPGRMLHLRSASLVWSLVPSRDQVSLTWRALSASDPHVRSQPVNDPG